MICSRHKIQDRPGAGTARQRSLGKSLCQRLGKSLRHFRQQQDGTATVEFAIIVPTFMMLFMSTVELGVINLRQTQLDSALDIAVRNIRLSTGAVPQHNAIRDQICTISGFIDDCESSLRLEMVQLDPFNWTAPDPNPDCINQINNVQPVRTFTEGQGNELMLVRACMKFKPMFSSWGLGDSLDKDGDGRVSLFASSAFVQEPR